MQSSLDLAIEFKAREKMQDKYDLNDEDLRIMGAVYALSEQGKGADMESIEEMTGMNFNHRMKSKVRSLNDRVIFISIPFRTKSGGRAKTKAIYSLSAEGKDLLKEYNELLTYFL